MPDDNTTSEESESDQEDEVNFDDPKSLRKDYHELLSNLSILLKAYKNLWKDFKNISKDHLKLEKILQDQVDISLHESTQTYGACITLKEKESKLYLKIETTAREKVTLLKNFQELENKMKDLQKDLKDLNELSDYQNKKRNNLWRKCAQTYKDYEDLKMSKHNLWVECKELKIYVKFLNYKLLKNQEFKGQPQDVVKLHEEIRTLRTTLAKFFNEINNLNKFLQYCRSWCNPIP